jgi:hypothetical protein
MTESTVSKNAAGHDAPVPEVRYDGRSTDASGTTLRVTGPVGLVS